MKRLFFVIAALFFLVVACSKSRPKGILSDKEMSDLMTEVYILDSYLNNMPIDSGRKVMPVLYQQLFDKFKMDSTTFIKNLDYYYGNPVELEKVNAKVKDVLSRYEKEALRVDSIEQAHIRDSTHRVMKLQQQADEMKRLILEVHLDTTEYTFEANNSAFFQYTGLSVQRHELTKPMPKEADAAEVSEDEENEASEQEHISIDSNQSVAPLHDEIIERRIDAKEVQRRMRLKEIKQRSKL